jgi:hypothetical protein
MGMFDTVLVASSLIDEVVKGTDLNFEPFNGYCDFQTKDLDNLMTSFFIEADGSFFWEKREYEYEPPVETVNKRCTFGSMKLVGEPQKIEDTRTAYIEFYDFYNTEEERIFATFIAHVKNGKLVEPISIKSIERTNLAEEAIRHKESGEKWDRVKSSWQWKLASFIFEARWKLVKLFRPLTSSIDKLENDLRNKAKQLHDVL